MTICPPQQLALHQALPGDRDNLDVWPTGPGVLDSFSSAAQRFRKWLEGGQTYLPAAEEEVLHLRALEVLQTMCPKSDNRRKACISSEPDKTLQGISSRQEGAHVCCCLGLNRECVLGNRQGIEEFMSYVAC